LAVRTTAKEYADNAMAHAEYKQLSDGTVAATIPLCPGVIEFGPSREETAARLRSALEGWIELGLRLGHPLPEVDGLTVETS
jgi:predicted RNase H-like HicB family nuclease